MNSNQWNIVYNIFDHDVKYYVNKIKSIKNINKKPEMARIHFRHNYKGVKKIPVIHDDHNSVDYISSALVTSHGLNGISMHRIEIRHNMAYIFIADKKLSNFLYSSGNNYIDVNIFNTFSIKYILAAALHIDDKLNFVLNYDDDNRFIDFLVPKNINFLIKARIYKETKIFTEDISFGDEPVATQMKYNKIKIFNIKYNSRRCLGIVQGGDIHKFLFDISGLYNNYQYKL